MSERPRRPSPLPPRDRNRVVAEERLALAREEKAERRVAVGEFFEPYSVYGLVKLEVEVIDPELVEVAEHDAAWSAGNGVDPVVEGLTIVCLELLAAALHPQEQALLPAQISELHPFALRLHAELKGRSGFLVAVVPEGTEEAIAEDLRLSSLVALQRSGVLKEGGDSALLFEHVGGAEGSVGLRERQPR